MRAQFIEKEQEQAWDQMVENHPFGSVYQTSPFKKVIAQTFPQAKPYYLALVDQRGNIRAGIPLFLVKSWLTGTRLVSLPFVSYSDPLVRSSEEFQQLFEKILDLYTKEGASYIEVKVRNSTSLLKREEMLKPVFYHRTYWIDLKHGLDYVWKNLHKTAVQQRIKRSEREGIEVRSATSENDVRLFWKLLVETRKRLGVPPQNYSFFQNIWRYLKPLQLTDFLVAELNGEIIGGLNIFRLRDKLYMGHIADKTQFRPLGVNHALTWRAIEISIQSDCRIFDIGKTSPYAEGLITYKKQWGAQELETPCFYYPHLKGVSSLNNEKKLSYRIMTLMWQKLPNPMLKMGSRFAYRHLG